MAWKKIASLADIPEYEGLKVDVDGHGIALFHVEGEVYAIDDMCSHAEAHLSQGFLEDCVIECPLHQACFDIRTGKVLSAPATEDVNAYEARIDGDDVLIDI
ncbi:bifunctional 3-phenylpropionate/cinnamic acid dioxygenase ferredoxin subunit [Parvularcula marina]|uniref:Bifunctional 3-phenylpropionate/cinnamic acid dioxygenase ferredoxin subunit n=1 Tax=Parvularcula marina TaxID=2292771 RepID=A0A371RLB9_9PROT|nr:bifunctional 3-phenylpropionate/cinnamic acid dioxygenase ferredoxin subunit [Parvularcula marina]RFB06262.1 bifunctional 3-phenylpropionate/cinnamic acid dioxygenase ferredoxin subunit [Parvularcula marina]